MRGGRSRWRSCLEGVQAPWYVAAGWAIDLFLGEERREHEDLEIAVPRVRFPEIGERLSGFELFIPDSDLTDPGLVWPFAQAPNALAGHHQTWVREPESGRWRLDVFREPSDGDVWIYRRDERIRLPYPRRDRADRRRHPVRATGARPALQGEARRAAEGRGRLRGRATAARVGPTPVARGCASPRPSRPSLVGAPLGG